MNLSRRMSSVIRRQNTRFKSNNLFKEIRIPVPWGHIAGKWWGPQDKRPILTIHGWQDNCGSFDRLIPVLPRYLGYLAIDLPGHGYSSRLPPGAIYAHSNGAMTSYSYGFMHPETVDFIICIDAMQMDRNPVNSAVMRKCLDDFIKYEKQCLSKAEPPSYSRQEMVQKVHTGYEGSIDFDNCEYILKRNVAAAKDKPGFYYFNMDPRLKCFDLINWGTETHRDAAKLITFPVLIILAHDKVDYMGAKVNSFINLMEASKFFESHKFKVTHHGHLNNPEIFADLITKFIEKHDQSDRTMTFDIRKIIV